MTKGQLTVAIAEENTSVLQQIKKQFLEQVKLLFFSNSDLTDISTHQVDFLFVSYSLLEKYHSYFWQIKKVTRCPVIAYSYEDSSQKAVKALKWGADDYWLTEVITFRHLSDHLRSIDTYQSDLQRVQEENYTLHDTIERFADHIRKRTEYFIETNEALQKEIELRSMQENTLEQVIQRLTSHLDNSPLAVVEWDKESNILRWSKQAEHIFGWQAAEVLGRKMPVQHFAHPDDKELVRERIERLFQKEEKNNVSFNRNITKSGEVVYCEWYNTALYNDKSEIDVVLSIVHNVTSFKLYEQELLASQERFEKLSQASFDAIIIHDNGIFIDCNQKYLTLFQRDLEECMGIDTFQFFTRASRAVIKQHMRDDFQQPYEVVGIRKDGTLFPVEAVSKSIHHDNKKVYLCALRDISQRKKEEQKLIESEARFRSTFEQAAVGLAHVSLQGKILRVNEKFCDITAYAKEALAMLPVEDLLNQSEAKEIEKDRKQIHKLMRGDLKYYIAEREILTGNRERIWVNLTLSCVRDKQAVKYFMVVIQNITQRKQTAFKLKEAHQELDEFVYNTSHDLRGPIASMIGLCEVALMEVTDTTSLHYLKMLEETSQRMNKILSSLLFVNEIKKRKVKKEEIHFPSLLNKIRVHFEKNGKLKQAQFIVKNHQEMPIYSDKNLLKSMFQYLIDNSLMYVRTISNEASYVRVVVSNEAGNLIKIIVEDNGIGIPRYMADKVFEMFFRGTERSKGLGLGLYITKHIIQKLGGNIMIENVAPHGTRVIITLPNAKVSASL
ncbi:MAG: PAS domain S-box protein [Thermonemataceae bacterium]